MDSAQVLPVVQVVEVLVKQQLAKQVAQPLQAVKVMPVEQTQQQEHLVQAEAVAQVPLVGQVQQLFLVMVVQEVRHL